jgi:hypothetical protein
MRSCSRILVFSYQFWATRGTKEKTKRETRLSRSIELFRQAAEIEPTYERTYFNSVYYYRHRRDPQTELRLRLKDLAAARVRYGYERLHTLLVREGWQINLKRVYRLYHEEGLTLRVKTKKKRISEGVLESELVSLPR